MICGGHRAVALENLDGHSDVVDQMGAANPLWGAPRIYGELSKLGIDVSERTVSRLLRRRDRPPSQTWRTFPTNHVTSLVSMDFFTVPTLTDRVLFVLAFCAAERLGGVVTKSKIRMPLDFTASASVRDSVPLAS